MKKYWDIKRERKDTAQSAQSRLKIREIVHCTPATTLVVQVKWSNPFIPSIYLQKTLMDGENWPTVEKLTAGPVIDSWSTPSDLMAYGGISGAVMCV